MRLKIGLVTLVVPEYEPAIAFYVHGLGFELVEDFPQGKKRWVVVRPKGSETGLLLARAVGPQQNAAIGNQTGGRVAFFLHTDNFAHMAARITQAGGTFQEEPRNEDYGKVGVFQDPFGNLWDLIQPAS